MMKSFAFLLGLALPASAAQIVYFSFDTDAVDEEPTAPNVTGGFAGDASITTSGQHIGAGALALDGNGDYLGLGTLNLGNQFTISAWVDANNTSQIQTIMANSIGGSQADGFRFFINAYNTNDASIRLETGNGTDAAGISSAAGIFSFADGYQHVAAAIDRSAGTATLYYNGTAVASGAVRTDFGNNQTTRIGAFTNTQFFMPGNIDEVRIYDEVLGASEIAALAAVPEPSGAFLTGFTLILGLMRRQR